MADFDCNMKFNVVFVLCSISSFISRIDLDTVCAMQLNDKRDPDYYKRITRSLHGLSLLKALCPIPPSTYNYEHIYRLLSMLFAWLETVAFKANIHVKIVDIVERYQAQAIEWITKVQNYDFHLYCDCLLPMPPVQARIGLAWDSLMSETRQLLEGLQKISSLNRFGLMPEKVIYFPEATLFLEALIEIYVFSSSPICKNSKQP